MGTTRRIDQLGRVVIPVALRRSLAIREGDLLEIAVVDGQLVLRKIAPQCAICGRDVDLIDLHEKHLCKECVHAIRLEPECAICRCREDLVELRESHLCKDCVQEIAVV